MAASQIEDRQQPEQQQPGNHSSDNAEIARFLTPFSHPDVNQGVQRAIKISVEQPLIYQCKEADNDNDGDLLGDLKLRINARRFKI